MLYRTNNLIRQLTALRQQLVQSGEFDGQATPANANARRAADPRVAQVNDAVRKLTQLRDSAITRPMPELGYRQYPRLREEVTTIGRMISGPTAPPTEAQIRRYGELVGETDRVDGALNAIVAGEIGKINEMMRASPRIFAGAAPIM
jgi:galactokinase